MPELDLGKRRAAARGEAFVVRINAEDADDGQDHSWPLPRVLTQQATRKLREFAKFAQNADQIKDTTDVAQLGVMVDVMDDLFKLLFGANAEDASKHLGPEDLESIMEFYGVKMGESFASASL